MDALTLIEVDWLDSVSLFQSGWATREEFDEAFTEDTVMSQRSVGYVLGRSRRALMIAQSVQLDEECEEPRRRFAGVQIIPAKAILSEREL